MHDEYALVQINLQVKRRSLRRGLIIDLNAAVRALAHQRYEAGYIIAQTRANDARHRRRPCLTTVAHRPPNILNCTSPYHRLRAASLLAPTHLRAAPSRGMRCIPPPRPGSASGREAVGTSV